MLAKLVLFSKFANLSVIAGIVAISGMLAGKTDLLTTNGQAPNGKAPVATCAAADDRASEFAACESNCPPQSQPPEWLPTPRAPAAANVPPTSGQSRPQFPPAELDLNVAADTGCRLFGRLVQAQCEPAPPQDVVKVAHFASPSHIPRPVAAAAGGPLRQAGYCELPTRTTADLPCVSAPVCDISANRTMLAAHTAPAGTPTASAAPITKPRTQASTLAVSGGVSRRVSPATCRLCNRETKEPLATLQIGGQIDTTRMTSEELAAYQALRAKNTYVNSEPSVRVTRNPYSETWLVEARNIELPDLIEQLAHYYTHPIVCGADVRGTVSATVSAYSMDEALHRIIAPFGFTLGREGSTLIVGSEFPASDATSSLEVAATTEAQPVELTETPTSSPQLAEAEVVDRLPPVENPSAITVAALRPQQQQLQIQDVETADAVKTLIADGRTDAALRLISSEISAQPNSAFLFRLLGEAFAFQADYDRAAVALEHSIKLNKYDPTTSQVFSKVLAQLGQQQRSDHYAHMARDIRSGLVAP